MVNITELMDKLSSLDFNDPTTVMTLAVGMSTLLLIVGWFTYNPRVDIDTRKSVVIVTGCDSGFGLGLVKTLSGQGYVVIATCMTKEGVTRIKDIAERALICDVTNESDIQTLSKVVYTYIEQHNECRLWALINNAGIPLTGFIDWLPIEAFRKIMEVNYFAPIRLSKEFLPLLKRCKGSRIVNLSSLAGFLSGQCMGPYSGSKHALEGVGKAMRDELAPWNIQVYHFNPGFMATNILSASSEGARKYFSAAPADVQKQYGPDWLQILGENAEKVKQDPALVSSTADSCTAALISPHDALYYASLLV